MPKAAMAPMEKERKKARASTPSATAAAARPFSHWAVLYRYREITRPKAIIPAETLALEKMPVMRTPDS